MRLFLLTILSFAIFPAFQTFAQVTDDNVNTNEDTQAIFSVVSNDSDPDGIDPASVDLDITMAGRQTFISTAEGNFSVDAAGNVTFDPTPNFNGTVTRNYSVNNNLAAEAGTALITITVIPVNDPPVAVNDVANTNKNVPVDIPVAANDSDIDGTLDGSAIDVNTSLPGVQAQNITTDGVWDVIGGLVRFSPIATFTGDAAISYTINDDLGGTSNTATITVTVVNVNYPPTANNDSGVTNENTPVIIMILANDTDDSGLNPASVDLNTTDAGIQSTNVIPEGNFSVALGVLTFTPTIGFSGTASIDYTVQDNEGLTSNSASITVTVNNVNTPPVTANDAAATNENIPVNISILANDTDDAGINAASVDLHVPQPGIQNTRSTSNGTFSANASGIVTYTPTSGFSGTADVSYTVQDNEGATSNASTITVTVTNVNTPPVANNDTGVTNENVAVNIDVLANDTDDSGINTATVDLNTVDAGVQNTLSVTEGSFSVNASGVVTFTPTANFVGIVSISYTVQDNEGATSNSATIEITVNNVNAPPVATNDTGVTNENVAVNISILANDTDDAGLNSATVDLNTSLAGIQNTNSTAQGTFSVNGSGVLTYTPTTDFVGSATISYTVQDTEGATSNSATVTITVSNVNAAPVASNDTGTTSEDTPVNISILANDTDDAGLNPATVDINTLLAGIQNTNSTPEGNFSVNGSGVLTFTPVANFSGTATINYTVNDTEGLTSNTATVTITVNNINDAPVAVGDAAMTTEDNSVTILVTSNDTDSDGTIDPATVDLNPGTPGIQTTRTTSNGSYSVNASGQVTFTPTNNFNGIATIQYTVNDNLGLVSNAATITITVNASNDAPVANNDATSTNENVAVSINVVANDTDDNSINSATVDLDPSAGGIQNSIAVAQGTFTVNSSGVVTFSPTANVNGVASASYTVNDNEGATSNQATITVTIISVNDKPVAVNDAISTNEDTPASINVTTNDTDDGTVNAATVDLDVSTAGIQTTRTIAEGTFTVNASGMVSYAPAANYFGTFNVRYAVNDNEGATSDPGQIAVTVISVNDKPVAVGDSRTINEDNSVAINVVANDTDVDGTVSANSVDLNPAIAGIQSSVTTAEGTFTTDASGVVTFVPATNFFGSVSSSYTINDNAGATSDPALISITVNSINDSPIANNDIANIAQAQVATFNIVSNDIDVDGTISVNTVDLDTSVPGIQNTKVVAGIGTYVVDATGTVTFTPLVTFSGTSSITYTVQDNTSAVSNAATISVLVNFVNMAPVANDDAVTTNEDTPVSVNVIANDTDDGTINASTVDLNTSTSGIQNSITTSAGTFNVNGSGLVTFTPALNFNGTATLTYSVNDNIGATSNAATISINITPVNDVPVAVNDAGVTNEDTPVTIKVLDNDKDADGTLDPASVDLLTATPEVDRTRTVTQGTFTVDAGTGIVTFTPVANFNGAVSITYNVKDNLGAASNAATINVTVNNVNDAPVFDLIADQRVLRNAAAKAITITGISPGPGETEQILISAVSSNTSLVPNPTITYAGTGTTATLTFKPQLNQSGFVDVIVKVIDEGLNEFTRTFRINVINVVITSTPVTLAEEGALYEYLIETSEVEETLSLVALQKPAWATLSSTGKNKAKLSGTPPPNSVGSTVIIQLRDGATVIDEQQYTLNINRRPSATSFGLQTNEDVSLILSFDHFVAVYTDPDNQPLAEIRFTKLPNHGSLLLSGAPVAIDQVIPSASLPNLVYQPEANYNGLDTLYFRVGDSFSFSDPSVYLHFVINPVNDPPLITFVETIPMEYDIGLKLAQNFTSQFTAIEVEGENIVSAEVGFVRPNFDPIHDLLEFSDIGNIKGTYDENAGILSLSGSATVTEYEQAIRSIKYNFQDLTGVDLRTIVKQPRTLYINLSDAAGKSEAKERVINLIFDFVELNIPNVFSPDGNGLNDLWPFKDDSGLEPYQNAVIRIYDIRGRLIFETRGFNSPWDGKMKGTYLPRGTYFYVIDLRYGDITYNGSVTILRATE